MYLGLFCSVLHSLHRPTCPHSISYPPERQSSSCPQPIIHHCVLWVWAQKKSNEQQSYLSASRSSEAELRLVMNLDYPQQVPLKLTYDGPALTFSILLFTLFSFHGYLKWWICLAYYRSALRHQKPVNMQDTKSSGVSQSTADCACRHVVLFRFCPSDTSYVTAELNKKKSPKLCECQKILSIVLAALLTRWSSVFHWRMLLDVW